MTGEQLRAGDPCGPYEIVREIGRGGMGVVYLARAPGGEMRAIKTLAFSGKLRDVMVQRFKQEISLVASLEHVNLVRFYDAGRIGTGQRTAILWLAMEYLEGKTLREILSERGALSVEDTARWCMHVADGLCALHKLDVVHRDLKPENVMIVKGIAKVFDLGIAKAPSWGAPTTAQGMAMGTMVYMAPEQLGSSKKAGPWTDVYALGLLLYELATGSHPICPLGEPLLPAEIIGRVVFSVPEPLADLVPGFPRDLSEIAYRAVQKAPEHRFASMADMRDALERALMEHRMGQHAETLAAIGAEIGPHPLRAPAMANPRPAAGSEEPNKTPGRMLRPGEGGTIRMLPEPEAAPTQPLSSEAREPVPMPDDRTPGASVVAPLLSPPAPAKSARHPLITAGAVAFAVAFAVGLGLRYARHHGNADARAPVAPFEAAGAGAATIATGRAAEPGSGAASAVTAGDPPPAPQQHASSQPLALPSVAPTSKPSAGPPEPKALSPAPPRSSEVAPPSLSPKPTPAPTVILIE